MYLYLKNIELAMTLYVFDIDFNMQFHNSNVLLVDACIQIFEVAL